MDGVDMLFIHIIIVIIIVVIIIKPFILQISYEQSVENSSFKLVCNGRPME